MRRVTVFGDGKGMMNLDLPYAARSLLEPIFGSDIVTGVQAALPVAAKRGQPAGYAGSPRDTLASWLNPLFTKP